jgi:threonine aldolase
MALPDPPACSFASDNTAGVLPEVLDALAAANTPAALAYGSDRWTEALTERFRAEYDAPVEVLLCWGGTGAHVVGLASLLAPWQAIICTDDAHIAVDECGAPTRFSGAMLLTVPTDDGKLVPAHLDRFRPYLGDEHHPQPAVVSISQVTELGTVYTVDEIGELAEAVHAAGMNLHLDGARIANAVAATGAGLPEMIRDTGVDVMTFGATKNGAMYGEAVVYVRPELADGARFTRKQAGQLPSKARFVAAQLLALIEEDRWIHHAAHANAMAVRLADAARSIDGVTLAHEPAANAVFVHLPRPAIDALQAWSFFWDWDHETSMVRWMTSFATTEADVDRFVAGVRAVLASS